MAQTISKLKALKLLNKTKNQTRCNLDGPKFICVPFLMVTFAKKTTGIAISLRNKTHKRKVSLNWRR